MADASIFAEYLKPVRSVQDYQNEYDKQKLNQLELAGAIRKNQQGEQDAADRNALQQLLRSGVNLDTPEGQAKAYGAAPGLVGPLLKQRAEIAAQTATAGMNTAHGKNFTQQTAASEYELAQKKRAQASNDVLSAASPDIAHQIINTYEQRGDFDPQTAQMIRQTVPQDPAQMPQWQLGMLRHLMTPKDNMESRAAHFGTQEGGDRSITTGFDKYTGAVIPGSGQTVVKAQSPDSVAREARALQIAQMQDARARETANTGKAPTLTTIIDPADPTKMITVDARTYNPTSRAGVIGVSGKEPGALKREEQATTGREQVSGIVSNLRDMYSQLNEGGGIVNSEKGALSNIPARLSATGVGQFSGQLVGTKNQKLRDTVEQQRPLLLNAIKNATGMSAKQMDSNAEMRLYLSAATDPTKDIAANMEALDNLEKLYGQSAKGGQVPKPAPNPSGKVVDFGSLK